MCNSSPTLVTVRESDDLRWLLGYDLAGQGRIVGYLELTVVLPFRAYLVRHHCAAWARAMSGLELRTSPSGKSVGIRRPFFADTSIAF